MLFIKPTGKSNKLDITLITRIMIETYFGPDN